MIETQVTTKSYTVSGLVLGSTYDFTIESRNIKGYSPVSQSVQILHALKPEKPDTPVLTNTGTEITIDWETPIENGSAITSYKILIRTYDGETFVEELTHCDGSDSALVTSTQCTIPLTTLEAIPFSLVPG